MTDPAQRTRQAIGGIVASVPASEARLYQVAQRCARAEIHYQVSAPIVAELLPDEDLVEVGDAFRHAWNALHRTEVVEAEIAEGAEHGAEVAAALWADFEAKWAEEAEEEDRRVWNPADPGPFPVDLLRPGGLLGEWLDYTESQAIKPQPVLSLAAALVAFGAVLGRKVRSEMGARTNLYAIGLAGTGEGKANALKCNKDILHHAGMATDAGYGVLGPEDIASDAGMVAALQARPSCLVQLDEVGRFCRTLSNPAKAPHLYAVITLMLRLYGQADTLFLGKAYADAKRNVTIQQPCLCWYGATVPDSFFASITAESLTDGFVPRLLLFQGSDDVDERQPCLGPPPISLVHRVRQWRSYGAEESGVSLQGEYPEPMVVERTEAAERVFSELGTLARVERRKCQEGPLADLWTRVVQKADQISLIHGCSKHGREAPVVDEESAAYAARMVVYLTQRMIYDCHRRVSDGEHDAEVLRVLRVIERAGARGITQTAITRATRGLKKGIRDDILHTLIEGGYARRKVVETKGRSINVYYI